MEGLFLPVTSLWQVLGAIDDDERLTSLGWWGLPEAMLRVWAPSGGGPGAGLAGLAWPRSRIVRRGEPLVRRGQHVGEVLPPDLRGRRGEHAEQQVGRGGARRGGQRPQPGRAQPGRPEPVQALGQRRGRHVQRDPRASGRAAGLRRGPARPPECGAAR